MSSTYLERRPNLGDRGVCGNSNFFMYSYASLTGWVKVSRDMSFSREMKVMGSSLIGCLPVSTKSGLVDLISEISASLVSSLRKV